MANGQERIPLSCTLTDVGLRGEYGEEFDKVSKDIRNVLIDKAEAEHTTRSRWFPKDKE